jgi:hypothetical protein
MELPATYVGLESWSGTRGGLLRHHEAFRAHAFDRPHAV